MMTRRQLELSSRLGQWQNFEECLLHEIRWTKGLYSADLVFNYVWDSNGAVRENVLGDPELITLSVVGVERFEFFGALTGGMKREPERVDWGLSEVAGVRVGQQGDLLVISVDWESERRLDIACVSAGLVTEE